MAEPAIEEIVTKMLDLREKREALKKAYEAEDKRLQEFWDKGESWLMNKLNTLKVDSVKVAGLATVFTTVKQRASVGDWSGFNAYVKQTGNVELFQKRLAEAALKELLDSNGGVLPPGVQVSPVRTLSIRKA